MNLPRPVDVDGDWDWAECPWCRSDVTDAQLRLGDLFNAHTHGALKLADIKADGQAGPFALTSDCPSCGKGFIVTLRGFGKWPLRWRWLTLFGVRTAADAAMIKRGAA